MKITLKLAPKEPAHPTRGRARDRHKEKDAFLSEEPASGAVDGLIGGERSILVADDNPVVLKAFEGKLKAKGFKVTTTSNGATVASLAEESKAELIILDVNFPGIGGSIEWNGFTIIQWVRRFPELANIPVILISGDEPSKHKDKALAAGAAGFFQKPVDGRELIATILRVLGGGGPGQPAG